MANESTTIEVLPEFAGETVQGPSRRWHGGNTDAFRTFVQARVVWIFRGQQEFRRKRRCGKDRFIGERAGRPSVDGI